MPAIFLFGSCSKPSQDDMCIPEVLVEDTAGRIEQRTAFYSDMRIKECVFDTSFGSENYRYFGSIVICNKLNKAGNLEDIISYRTDIFGRLLSSVRYIISRSTYDTIFYNYSADGLLIYEHDRTHFYKTIYTYKNENLISKFQVAGSDTLRKWFFEYGEMPANIVSLAPNRNSIYIGKNSKKEVVSYSEHNRKSNLQYNVHKYYFVYNYDSSGKILTCDRTHYFNNQKQLTSKLSFKFNCF